MVGWIADYPFSSILIGSGAVAVVCLIIWALSAPVRRMSWRQHGFLTCGGLELCWEPRRLPLVVWFHPDLPGTLRVAWEAAAATFEAALGMPLFQRAVEAPAGLALERMPTGQIGVVPDAPRESMRSYHGRTQHRWDPQTGSLEAAIVVLPWSANGSPQYYVALHEAGHVLGLDHVDDTSSIMYPDLGARRDPGCLSDLDVQRLRGLYSKND